MSTYLNQYLGPYIQIKEELVTKTGEFKTCLNPQCKLNRHDLKTLFGAVCGKYIVKATRSKVEVKHSHHDIMALVNESFSCVISESIGSLEGFSFFIPNHHRKPPRSLYLNLEEDMVINDFSIQQSEIEWFKNAFSVELKKVEDLVGVENIKVSWGLISYYS
jgi:hypothetical protein